MEKELERENKNKKFLTEQFNLIQPEHLSDIEDNDPSLDVQMPSTSTSTRKHRRLVKTGTSTFINPDILKDPDLQQHCERIGLSPAQTASIARKLIERSGGDLSKISCSYSTADRSRTMAHANNVETIKKQWTPPDYVVIHWDGKLMASLTSKYKVEDRLPVVVSGGGYFQLLGIPVISKNSGEEKAGSKTGEAVLRLLSDWNCLSRTTAMVCDTTASNTGHVSAACITLQQKVKKHLLWAMCRHHIGELIVSHVFKELFEASKAPEVKLFVRLQKVFDQLAHTDPQKITFAVNYVTELPSILQNLRNSFLGVVHNMSKNTLPRDDY